MPRRISDQIISEIEKEMESFPDDAWEIMNKALAGHSIAVHNEVRRRMGYSDLGT